MSSKTENDRRHNQKERTRRAVIAAARELLSESLPLTMDNVAERALISRATIYRYFPNIDSLILEKDLDDLMPTMEQLTEESGANFNINDVVNALFRFYSTNEKNFRRFLATTLVSGSSTTENSNENTNRYRTVRRSELIEVALRNQGHDPEEFSQQLSIVLGPELYFSSIDACRLTRREARQHLQAISAAILNHKGS